MDPRKFMSVLKDKRAAKLKAAFTAAGVEAGHPIYRYEVLGSGAVSISFPAETEGRKILEARRK